MKAKNVLIFGCSGQIGRSIVRKLTKDNYTVTAVTRNIHQKGIVLKTAGNSGFINIVGGCCGTTPEHIKAIAEIADKNHPRKIPKIKPACQLSGLEPFNIMQDSLFINIGERCNVTGSAKFKKLIIIHHVMKCLFP